MSATTRRRRCPRTRARSRPRRDRPRTRRRGHRRPGAAGAGNVSSVGLHVLPPSSVRSTRAPPSGQLPSTARHASSSDTASSARVTGRAAGGPGSVTSTGTEVLAGAGPVDGGVAGWLIVGLADGRKVGVAASPTGSWVRVSAIVTSTTSMTTRAATPHATISPRVGAISSPTSLALGQVPEAEPVPARPSRPARSERHTARTPRHFDRSGR